MIVRHFLDWVRTAPAGKRAEATSALARAYLYSDLSPDDLAAAEGAMLMLLDDPSPLVRRALADALAASPSAPPAIVHGAGRRPAADRGAGAGAVAAFRRRRSGRCGGDRRRRRAGRDRQPRRAAALGRRRHRRSRHGGSLPGAAGKSARPTSRRSRSIASSSASATSPPSAKPLLARDDICRRRRGRRWSPSCRRRLPVSSPSAQWLDGGSRPAHRARGLREGDGGARGGHARRRRCARWSVICARAGNSPPGLFCARCCPAMSCCSRRRWPN